MYETCLEVKMTSFSIIHYFLANPDSIDGEEQNKKLPPVNIKLTTSRLLL